MEEEEENENEAIANKGGRWWKKIRRWSRLNRSGRKRRRVKGCIVGYIVGNIVRYTVS